MSLDMVNAGEFLEEWCGGCGQGFFRHELEISGDDREMCADCLADIGEADEDHQDGDTYNDEVC